MRTSQVGTELLLPLGDFVDGNRVKLLDVNIFRRKIQSDTHQTVNTSENNGNLYLSWERFVLALLCVYVHQHWSDGGCQKGVRTQELCKARPAREQKAGRGVEIGTELSEGSDFTVLSQVQLQGTSKLFHDFAVTQAR